MKTREKSKRAPRAFAPDDPNLEVSEAPEVNVQSADVTSPAVLEEITDPSIPSSRGLKWGGILLSALGGLITLGAGLWLTDMVSALLVRQDWIGWMALALLAIAAASCVMIAMREAWALLRLNRLGKLRQTAESAALKDDKDLARKVATGLQDLYRRRPDLAWARARLLDHDEDFMTAHETLSLSERELMKPLDAEARAIIAATAKRVSVVTAISPLALLDMAVVAAQNLRMLRLIATVYGARPGMFGLLRLARMVVTHIVLTGGIALGDDLIQQLIGHRLMAKLSARLGEGLFNGALTARIGLATIDVCRPLPFIETTPPRLRTLLADIARQVTAKS